MREYCSTTIEASIWILCLGMLEWLRRWGMILLYLLLYTLLLCLPAQFPGFQCVEVHKSCGLELYVWSLCDEMKHVSCVFTIIGLFSVRVWKVDWLSAYVTSYSLKFLSDKYLKPSAIVWSSTSLSLQVFAR